MRKLTESMKKVIAGRQLFKCANVPNSDVLKSRYSCPLWTNNENRGSFDKNGFVVNSKINNKIDNATDNDLHALCIYCHRNKI